MNFLKSITVLVLVTYSISANAQWGKSKKVKGNGDVTTITRSTSFYDGVKLSGALDVKLVEGKEGSITIKGDSNLNEYIITEVKNSTLIVKVKKGYYLKPSKSLIITVPYESIENVSISGSGDIENIGTIKANTFEISVSGSGDINLNLDVKTVSSRISGSGDIELNGTTNDLDVSISGSGDFSGSGLKSTNVNVKISGSGDADVVCNGKLTAKVYGSGDISYSGNPTYKDTKVLGSGSISN